MMNGVSENAMSEVKNNGKKSTGRNSNLKKFVKRFFVGGSIFFLVKGLIWLAIFFAATLGFTDLMK